MSSRLSTRVSPLDSNQVQQVLFYPLAFVSIVSILYCREGIIRNVLNPEQTVLVMTTGQKLGTYYYSSMAKSLEIRIKNTKKEPWSHLVWSQS